MYLKSASTTQRKVRFISSLPWIWGFELYEVLNIQAGIYVCTQTWLFTSNAEDEVLPNELRHVGCEHMHWLNLNSLNKSLRFKISHLSAGEDLCFDCSTLICCSMCFTEIHADTPVVKYAPNVQIVITTQWKYSVEEVPLEAAQRRRCYRFEKSERGSTLIVRPITFFQEV